MNGFSDEQEPQEPKLRKEETLLKRKNKSYRLTQRLRYKFTVKFYSIFKRLTVDRKC